jgi:hypothetical protein
VNVGAALVASFLVTLVNPTTWALALAAFLMRGGYVVVLAPIVVIPSAVGLANVVAPLLTSFVFGGLSAGLLVLVVGAGLAGLTWFVLGGFLAAGADAEMTRIIATDEDVATAAPIAARRGQVWRIVVSRVIAFVPLAATVVWGASRLVAVAYRELTVPSDVTTSVVLRVVRQAPDALLLITVAWLFGQAVGSISTRAIVLGGAGVPGALRAAIVRLVRHPVSTAATEIVPLVGLALVIVPSAVAASTIWDGIRAALTTGGDALTTIVLVCLFVLLWTGGLLLVGVVSAWGAAAWTVVLAGTFGPMPDRRPGYWNATAESGTLSDPDPRGVDPDTR